MKDIQKKLEAEDNRNGTRFIQSIAMVYELIDSSPELTQENVTLSLHYTGLQKKSPEISFQYEEH